MWAVGSPGRGATFHLNLPAGHESFTGRAEGPGKDMSDNLVKISAACPRYLQNTTFVVPPLADSTISAGFRIGTPLIVSEKTNDSRLKKENRNSYGHLHCRREH